MSFNDNKSKGLKEKSPNVCVTLNSCFVLQLPRCNTFIFVSCKDLTRRLIYDSCGKPSLCPLSYLGSSDCTAKKDLTGQ